MKRKWLLAPIAGLCAATTANAADFTFDVPVSVRDVPMVTQVRVECFVSTVPIGGDARAADANVVGRGFTVVDAPAGTFDGTVAVPVENRGVLRSSEARSYGCYIIGLGRSASGTQISLSGNWSYNLERMTGTPLVSQNLSTEANLP